MIQAHLFKSWSITQIKYFAPMTFNACMKVGLGGFTMHEIKYFAFPLGALHVGLRRHIFSTSAMRISNNELRCSYHQASNSKLSRWARWARQARVTLLTEKFDRNYIFSFYKPFHWSYHVGHITQCLCFGRKG